MLNSNASGYVRIATNLVDDFTAAWWGRFVTSSGAPVMVVLNDATYLYSDSGNLTLQSVNCGACPTNFGFNVLRRIGSDLLLYRCAAGATTLTLLGTLTGFGAATVTAINIWGDSVFGASADMINGHLLIWNAQKSDAILLKERWNYHPQHTTDLEHFLRFQTVASAATAAVGANATVTGTHTLFAPKWIPVTDSIGRGKLLITDTPDADSMAGSNGPAAASGFSGFGITIDDTQAIPGESMDSHVANLASRLVPILVAAGPGSFVPIFGSVNDSPPPGPMAGGTAALCTADIQAIAQTVQAYGCFPIGVGPSTSSTWSTATFSADVRANIMADTTNFVDRWDIGAAGGLYTTTVDGIHFDSYAASGAFFKSEINSYLAGAPAAPVLSSSTPADGATGVSPSANIVLNFDVSVQAVASKNLELVNYTAPTTPTHDATTTDAQNTNATITNFDVPAVPTPNSGGSCVAIYEIAKDGSGAFTGTWPPAGWNIGIDVANGSANRLAVLWRRYTASASATTITVAGPSENYIGRVRVWQNCHLTADPVFATTATGTDAAANPPSLTIPWAPEPSVVGYSVGFDGNSSVSAHPTGWTTNGTSATTTDGTTTNRCALASSYNTNVTTSPQDPGTLTNTNEQWVAAMYAIRPRDESTIVETIAANNTSRVTVSGATATINPTSDLPGSKTIRVLADSGAFEASGGSLPWVGLVAGDLDFQTSSGAATLNLARPARTRRNASVGIAASGSVTVSLARPVRTRRAAGVAVASAGAAPVALARPSRTRRQAGLMVAPSGSVAVALARPSRTRRSAGVTLAPSGAPTLTLARPARTRRATGVTLSSGAGTVQLARPSRVFRSAGVTVAPSGTVTVNLGRPARTRRAAGVSVVATGTIVALGRPARTQRAAGVSVAASGSVAVSLARPARRTRSAGVTVSASGSVVRTLARPARTTRAAGLTISAAAANIALARPSRVYRHASVSIAPSGSAQIALAAPSRKVRRAGLTVQSESIFVPPVAGDVIGRLGLDKHQIGRFRS